jgi:hypothetical protein
MDDATYEVRAVHPKTEFPPVVEEYPTKSAADSRADRLYLMGYNVEVMPSEKTA